MNGYWSVEGTVLGTLIVLTVLAVLGLIVLAVAATLLLGWWAPVIWLAFLVIVGVGAVVGRWESTL